ncbi:hypothetical protein P152DRAFT_445994 [Eremomyces bilateralis CBS 781.70]|uniref:Uncharacterized protein n=1 Tax=Eremomyces bilateralis CBS 781.70 TaxID=1392243 RepID=A0A6G1GEI9_9PEZI|nr:uncharacterized protein P152DRAFT_445994 [Eremomyces bilateralis CBS 781.70]KAF1816326.1 hypothetical protein P152DRAFT_445994 [Eremomyces bilateralis CBS 781.70]
MPSVAGRPDSPCSACGMNVYSTTPDNITTHQSLFSVSPSCSSNGGPSDMGNSSQGPAASFLSSSTKSGTNSSWRLRGAVVSLSIENSAADYVLVQKIPIHLLKRFSLIARRVLHARRTLRHVSIHVADAPIPDEAAVVNLLFWMSTACRDPSIAPFQLPDAGSINLRRTASLAYAAAVLQVPRVEINLCGPMLSSLWREPPGAGEAEYIWERTTTAATTTTMKSTGCGRMYMEFDYRRALVASIAYFWAVGWLGDWDALEEVLGRHPELEAAVEQAVMAIMGEDRNGDGLPPAPAFIGLLSGHKRYPYSRWRHIRSNRIGASETPPPTEEYVPWPRLNEFGHVLRGVDLWKRKEKKNLENPTSSDPADVKL